MSIHSQLTGADLHENKGVATAAAGTVATASGTGTTNWLTPNNQTFLFANCASPGSIVIPIPEACTLIRFVVGLSSSYGVTVTLTNNISGAVTISPTIGAPGISTFTALSNNNFTAGTYLTFTLSSGWSAPPGVTFYFNIT